MKKLLIAGTLFVLSLFISSSAGAITVTINDDPGGATTYFGAQINPANGFSNVDVLPPGDAAFNIESLTATQSGGKTTVVLYGDYFGIHGDGTTGDEGDLYISTTGWHTSDPPGDVHHNLDQFKSSEGWNYVVSFATGDVYLLNLSTSGNILQGTASSTWGGSTFTGGNTSSTDRTLQAWQGGYGSLVWSTGVSVSLDTGAETLTFSFPDLPGQPTVDNWGFHWTMGCGNDVIEGQGTSVPEPGSLLLLGLGIAGLAVYRRRAS